MLNKTSLKDILFLLRLHASNILKEFTQYFVYIQLIINMCGTTSSLNDLIFAKQLNTIKCWKICSQHKQFLDLHVFSGFTRPNFQEVIPYTSATARSSDPILNSTSAKSQTSANKSSKHEINFPLWVSSPWVCSTSTRRISCILTSSAYVFWTERLHSESAEVHKKLDINHFAQPSLYINYRIKHKTTWFVI